MNENEMVTLEEVNNVQLYTTDEVETEENDGPGFGLGMLIGTGIGIAATVVAKKVHGLIKNKDGKVTRPKVFKKKAAEEEEPEIVSEQETEPPVLDMTKNKNKK